MVYQQLLAGLSKGCEAGHELLRGHIRHALGSELALDPGIDAHGPNGLDVARSGAEGKSVEDVVHLLVGRLLSGGHCLGRRDGGGRNGSGGPRRHRGSASQYEQGQPEQRVKGQAEQRQA